MKIWRLVLVTPTQRIGRNCNFRHLNNISENVKLTTAVSSHNSLLDNAKKRSNLQYREKFATALTEYMKKEKFKRGHVNFIKTALIRMDEFNVQKDLLTYNRLLDVFPKKRFVNKTFFDALWPRPLPQIDVALDVLQKMEDNGVRPNYTTYSLLCEIFGRVSFPVQKCMRIAYWFDKFENVDPYRIKGELLEDSWEISQMALLRIAGEKCQIWEITDPEGKVDGPFIIGASSQKQIQILKSLRVISNALLHIEGPHRLWLQKLPVFYYSLRLAFSDAQEILEVDSEDDGTILGVCMCRPPTQDTLITWLQYLQERYPVLKDTTVVYNVTVLDDLYHWYDTNSDRCISRTKPLSLSEN